ncbi:hypothetical protein COT48_00530 [Candidatus Woesearchaeota archaeon CG08_land_8_20_14_0_20_47_9]|nr:MAG: hypothetical protein COT48_00530 [Candidatus Woesearchaeota archaeon CG08_land_8_20_14_0_20_47_9]
MHLEPEELKTIRKQLNLTQSGLAKLAGVSQSLIAKIEAKSIDPTYSKVKKIASALATQQSKGARKIGSVMTRKVIYVSPSDTIKTAIDRMKKDKISQMPVIKNGMSVGLISEAIILDAITRGKTPDCELRGIMHDAPPIVSFDAPLELATGMLKYCPLLLVVKDGQFVGVVTRTDILKGYG